MSKPQNFELLTLFPRAGVLGNSDEKQNKTDPMPEINYNPPVCDSCHQSLTYLLPVDRGTFEIVKAIAVFIGQKGINRVHPRKEMEGEYLTSNQVGNLSRARFHGLIARVRDEKGNYLLTRKGAQFLRGEAIPKYAIISKVDHKNAGYFEEQKLTVTVRDLIGKEERWEGINFTIEEGRVVRDLPPKSDKPVQDTLFDPVKNTMRHNFLYGN